ncbi:MAG TPA: magnesium transporter CorA family protein [Stellaceae bacterium]|nr:magnesium transporter CorA family protein [Stellaceae bacterium]
MLALHSCAAHKVPAVADLSASALPVNTVWIDLVDASAAEVGFVERATGLHVPTPTELSEIESSSRLRAEKDVLYLSTPLVSRSDTGEPVTTSVGFVLRHDLLITVRFAELRAFRSFVESTTKPDTVHPSSAGAFVGLLEAMVDRMADVLEGIGTELDAVSHRIFRQEAAPTKVRRRPAREDADLREILRKIGRAGDLTSKIRDSLLGLGRMTPYVISLCAKWLPAEVKPHLETVRLDILSLNDYDAHLANNVQLLLDATLGLINIEQNNIIKVLTIVSVVGVPPTLIASMYGMNFKTMPEYDWAWGYPYGLTLIAVSAILPLLWFKLRGWL